MTSVPQPNCKADKMAPRIDMCLIFSFANIPLQERNGLSNKVYYSSELGLPLLKFIGRTKVNFTFFASHPRRGFNLENRTNNVIRRF